MRSQIKSIASNINNIINVASAEDLNYLSKVTNYECFAKRKLPMFDHGMKTKFNSNVNKSNNAEKLLLIDIIYI